MKGRASWCTMWLMQHQSPYGCNDCTGCDRLVVPRFCRKGVVSPRGLRTAAMLRHHLCILLMSAHAIACTYAYICVFGYTVMIATCVGYNAALY